MVSPKIERRKVLYSFLGEASQTNMTFQFGNIWCSIVGGFYSFRRSLACTSNVMWRSCRSRRSSHGPWKHAKLESGDPGLSTNLLLYIIFVAKWRFDDTITSSSMTCIVYNHFPLLSHRWFCWVTPFQKLQQLRLSENMSSDIEIHRVVVQLLFHESSRSNSSIHDIV